MPKLYYSETEADWHAIRHTVVSSTESAALFNMSPYLTAFELGNNKQSPTPPAPFDGNERMEWGKTLERLIAEEVGRRYGVKVRKLSAFAVHDESRMGASFDFEIVGVMPVAAVKDTSLQQLYQEHGPGVLECKNVDGLVFKRNWTDDDEDSEAPEHIEVQVQHQLEVIGRKWAAIAALVGGNNLHVITRMRDEPVGRSIRAKIDKLWIDLAAGILPDISYPDDAAFIASLYQVAEPGRLYDARGVADIASLVAEYTEAGKREKAASDDKKTAKARALQAMAAAGYADAEKVITDVGSISCGVVGPAEVAYTREGYRNFRVYPKKATAK